MAWIGVFVSAHGDVFRGPDTKNRQQIRPGPNYGNEKNMKILVADDHALFRAGLRYLLDQLDEHPEFSEAGSCEDLVEKLREDDGYDLVLIDLLMPGVETFSRVQEVCEIAGDVPVVVISVRERAEDVQRAIKAGAAGYIPKSSKPDVMINALKLVLSGGIYIPPNVLHLSGGSGMVASGAPPALEAGAIAGRLTGRQREVMALLAQGKSNKEIASELGLAAGTVKIHISNIFKALNVRNRTQAVIAAGESLADGGREMSAFG